MSCSIVIDELKKICLNNWIKNDETKRKIMTLQVAIFPEEPRIVPKIMVAIVPFGEIALNFHPKRAIIELPIKLIITFKNTGFYPPFG